jgi:hypothetical protein
MAAPVLSSEALIPGRGRAIPDGGGARRPAISAFRPLRVVAVVSGLLVPVGPGQESRAADGTVPEAGDPVDPAKRAKYNEWIECGLKEQTGAMARKLQHCKTKAATFTIYKAKAKPTHWKHGTPNADEVAVVLTPHATDKQIADCALCLIVNEDVVCKQIDEYGKVGQPAANVAFYKAYLKDLFRHELVHVTQWDLWSLWRLSNADLFNHPWGGGTADPTGMNGNPGGDASSSTYAADKATRALWDVFDECRTAYHEAQASLYGNGHSGCTNDARMFASYVDKGATYPPFVDEQVKGAEACKTKLFGDGTPANPGEVAKAGAAYDAVPAAQKGAYAKFKNFIDKLNAAKQAMCADIVNLRKEYEAAAAKYRRDHGG